MTKNNEVNVRIKLFLPYILIAIGSFLDYVSTKIALATGKLFEMNKYANPLAVFVFLSLLVLMNQIVQANYEHDSFMKKTCALGIVFCVVASWFPFCWNTIFIVIVINN